MRVAIVKYGAGNVRSVVNALCRVGVEPVLTDDAETLRRADRVVFPGQGEARQAMSFLCERGLDEVIKSLTQPVLGICIGQQLLCRHSDEGDVDCLGVFDANVVRFCPARHEDKGPHMGWNQIKLCADNALLTGVDGEYVYYVHSYNVPVCPDTIAVSEYITPFSAAMHKGNFYATQFHHEKSGSVGEKILQNFLAL